MKACPRFPAGHKSERGHAGYWLRQLCVGRHPRVRAGLTAAIGVSLLAACGTPAARGVVGPTPSYGHASPSGVHVYGWGFSSPGAVAAAGGDVWVADSGSASVFELNASTGALVRLISGSKYRFGSDASTEPMAVSTSSVWVINGSRGSLTELDRSTGALIRVVQGRKYGLRWPDAIAIAGGDVWVASSGGSVTELRESTGKLVRIVSGSRYGFGPGPDGIAVAGGQVWVANGDNDNNSGSVTELDASTGALIRVVSGKGFGLVNPNTIAVDGGHVWVANDGTAENDAGQLGFHEGLTELNASTGALVRVITANRYQFAGPDAITFAGGHVWVASGGLSVATELNEATGGLIRAVTFAHDDFYANGITVAGGIVWVSDGAAGITELNASTGAVVRKSNPGSNYRFDDPDGIALANGRVWVASQFGPITELNASTGGLVRTIPAPKPDDGPYVVVAAGRDVWVLNSGPGTVTELDASTGARIRYISDWGVYAGVEGLAAVGGHIWVSTYTSMTELSASTGGVVRKVSGPQYRFNCPDSLAVAGSHVWAANGCGNTVTELDASTGRLIRVISSSKYGFRSPRAIAAGEGNIWVANKNSVTELAASTGRLVRIISGPKYRFRDGQDVPGSAVTEAQEVAVGNGRVWVANPDRNSVTELDAATGALIRVLLPSKYRFNAPEATAVGGGRVWVVNTAGASVTEFPAS